MRKGLIDASSAILLAKAGLFFKIADFYDLSMVSKVYNEVSQERYPFARLFAIAVKQGRLKVVALPGAPASSAQAPTPIEKLHNGEKETLRRFFAGKEDFIIIDDGKGAAFCRDHGISYLNALLCPKILYFSGRLSWESCQLFTRRISGSGRYAPWVLKRAETLSADDLAIFL